MEQTEWEKLSPEEKRIQLYLRQKKTLQDFLERSDFRHEQTGMFLKPLFIFSHVRPKNVFSGHMRLRGFFLWS